MGARTQQPAGPCRGRGGLSLVLGAQLWRAAASRGSQTTQNTEHTLHRISRFRTQQPGNPRLAFRPHCVSRPVAETRRKYVGDVSVENPESPEPQSPHPFVPAPALGRGRSGRLAQDRAAQRHAGHNGPGIPELFLLTWKLCSLGKPKFPRGPETNSFPGEWCFHPAS